MFDTLADRIREDEPTSKTERYIRWGMVALISVVLFGGLYVVVRFLE